MLSAFQHKTPCSDSNIVVFIQFHSFARWRTLGFTPLTRHSTGEFNIKTHSDTACLFWAGFNIQPVKCARFQLAEVRTTEGLAGAELSHNTGLGPPRWRAVKRVSRTIRISPAYYTGKHWEMPARKTLEKRMSAFILKRPYGSRTPGKHGHRNLDIPLLEKSKAFFWYQWNNVYNSLHILGHCILYLRHCKTISLPLRFLTALLLFKTDVC